MKERSMLCRWTAQFCISAVLSVSCVAVGSFLFLSEHVILLGITGSASFLAEASTGDIICADCITY